MGLVLALVASCLAQETTVQVHSISDISQEFTFYMDGRFHRQYLKEVGRDQRNWGTLHKLDLSNANLLILTGGDFHIPYSEASVDHVEAFVGEGGAVLIMADGRPEAGEGEPPSVPVAPLVERFGGRRPEALRVHFCVRIHLFERTGHVD